MNLDVWRNIDGLPIEEMDNQVGSANVPFGAIRHGFLPARHEVGSVCRLTSEYSVARMIICSHTVLPSEALAAALVVI
jgi:hypothetical protein